MKRFFTAVFFALPFLASGCNLGVQGDPDLEPLMIWTQAEDLQGVWRRECVLDRGLYRTQTYDFRGFLLTRVEKSYGLEDVDCRGGVEQQVSQSGSYEIGPVFSVRSGTASAINFYWEALSMLEANIIALSESEEVLYLGDFEEIGSDGRPLDLDPRGYYRVKAGF